MANDNVTEMSVNSFYDFVTEVEVRTNGLNQIVFRNARIVITECDFETARAVSDVYSNYYNYFNHRGTRIEDELFFIIKYKGKRVAIPKQILVSSSLVQAESSYDIRLLNPSQSTINDVKRLLTEMGVKYVPLDR